MVPASLIAPCDDCGTSVRRTGLREFGERLLCPGCFESNLDGAEAAMRAMLSQLHEPERLCSNCAAMVNPEVRSSWCPILELGDTRAVLCQSFVPLALQATATGRLPPTTAPLEGEDLWRLVCMELEGSLGPTHVGWLRNTRKVSLHDGTLTVQVTDEYTRSWMVARLTPSISQALESAGFPDTVVEFAVSGAPGSAVEALTVVTEPRPLVPEASLPASRPASFEPHAASSFNPAFGFDQFVVGTGNRLAHAGALAVAEGGSSYNPLFIYGGVGVGKTHLLQAIGGLCVSRNRDALYVSSETFTNELIGAIRAGNTSEFRERYRQIDVLLVDDIQFIIGKESTQEEFFHTFNWLHDNGKQIVLSSDRSPNEMRVLDERLRSRFWWGLTADIQSPDLETRLEILRRKSMRRNRRLADDVLTFLASQANHSVRELEGLLNRLLALSDLHGVEPSLGLAAQVGKNGSRGRGIDHSDVLRCVSAYFGVSASALTGKLRSREVSNPRHIAMYLMREDANLSLPHIGDILGGRDHTTVLYGHRRVQKDMAKDGRLKHDVEAIRGLLSGTRAG